MFLNECHCPLANGMSFPLNCINWIIKKVSENLSLNYIYEIIGNYYSKQFEAYFNPAQPKPAMKYKCKMITNKEFCCYCTRSQLNVVD